MKILEKIKKIDMNVKIQKLKESWNALPFMKRETLTEEDRLIQDIQEVQEELLQARVAFDLLSHRDLIESCIYQIESLEVKYNYLIKQARQRGLCCPFIVQSERKEGDSMHQSLPLGCVSSSLTTDYA